MQSRYAFFVSLCLSIVFSSTFGFNDVERDSTVQSFIQEFQSLRNRVSVLESVIEKQTEMIQVQNDRIVKLESLAKFGSFNEKDLENLKYSLHGIEAGTNQPYDNNIKTTKALEERRSTSNSFFPRNTPQERKPERTITFVAVHPVAFYAYMNSTPFNIGGHHTLIFDVTKTNEGNEYHAHLGVFIVPRSGLYFFSWTMALNSSSYHPTELVVNNQVHGAIHLLSSPDERSSVTGNLILRLNEQDEVFIRTRENPNHGQILSDAYGRTSFSGFFIA